MGAKQIALAEQQLLGFKHGQAGFDLISLVSSMGLTSKEWKVLKKDYEISYLTDDEKKEIEEYFNNLK